MVRKNKLLFIFVLTMLTAAVLFAYTNNWNVSRDNSTTPNQGRRILYNPSNGYLHIIFESSRDVGNIAYTYSTNGGQTWQSLEGINKTWFDGGASFALEGNTPWMAWEATHASVPYSDMCLWTGVRRSQNNWNTGSSAIWYIPYGQGEADILTTSTVVSPSGGTSPMAYTVFAWTKYGLGYPSGWSYIYFIAWDTIGGSPRAVYTSSIEEINLGSGVTYNMEASIAVSGQSNADTIHICYRYKENGVDRIFYKKNTNWINPARIRSGTYPTWSDRILISTSSNPITEPASQPSIEFSGTGDQIVVIVWKGPNESGQNIGEVWKSTRILGYGWSTPYNVSQSPSSESKHGESSLGGHAVTYEEQITTSNWETYLY